MGSSARQEEHIHVEVDAILRDESHQKAILVVFEGRNEWVPRSQIASIEGDRQVNGKPAPRIWVTPWIAKQKGFV
jgi:hypothetical protein